MQGGGGKRSDLLSLATGHFFFPDELSLRAPPPHLSSELGLRVRYGANKMVFRVPRLFFRILQLSVVRERLGSTQNASSPPCAAAGRLVSAGFGLGI